MFAQRPEPRAVYTAACAACHGDDGRGRGASELGFDVPLPDFTDCDFAVREPDSDWYAIAHRGGPIRGFDRLMPAFGEALQPEEIEAALARIRAFCTDARWPRGELNLPRALFTEKAYPEDEAVITTTLVGEGADSITHEFVWEQRFGPLNQIELKMPITRADLGDPDGWKSGTGDLGIGVKHTMRHSLERGAILAVGGELVLPTGDETKGFGKGTTVLESFVLYGKILPRDAFVQLQGVLEFPHDSAFEDEAVFRAVWARLGRSTHRSAAASRRCSRCSAARDSRGARRRVGPRSTASSLAEQTPACPWRGRDSPTGHRPREPLHGVRVLPIVGLVRRRRPPGLVAEANGQ